MGHVGGLSLGPSPTFCPHLPKSEQGEGGCWFRSCTFSVSPCWSHARSLRLHANVSTSRKVGQLVCHSKKFFGKFNPHTEKRNTFVRIHLVQLGFHYFPLSLKAAINRSDQSSLTLSDAWGLFSYSFASHAFKDVVFWTDYLLSNNQYPFPAT